ncbi:MAG: ABC transporter permease [Chloroflexi bacterium]|nr:ABC transporter permease [Chloroflexota bacterium]
MHDIIIQLVNGLVVGLSLALVASGLALIFGVLGIVNFAQGEFYMLGGFTLFFVYQATHNFVIGLVAAALVVGIGGGLILQGMVWPLLDKSHALSLLATLGLSLIIQQLALNFFGGTTRIVPAPVPGQIPIEGISYPIYNLVIVVAGGAILVAGFLFLKYTKYGIWLRAVAENRSMATGLGVPVPRVYFLAFALSSALAGIAGALLAPVQSVYAVEGSDVIASAFIIVVAGGMGNFRGAALVALLLGEVQALGSIWFRPSEVEVFALGLVIVLMVMRSRQKTATAPVEDTSLTARGQAAAERPGSLDRLWAGVALVLVVLALVPLVIGGSLPQRAAVYLIYGLLALSVSLIIGFARLLNIGIGAIFGLGAYAVAIMTQHGISNPLIVFAVAIAVGLIVSLLFGLYANVASGVEYMMLTFLTTLAMATLPSVAPQLTGGDNGLQVKGGLQVSFGLNPLVGSQFYLFVLAVTGVCVLGCWFILNSQMGRSAQAIGRNAVRASALGYRVSNYRMAVTLLSGFLAATAGWLYALENSFVSQDLLGLSNSLNGILYSLVGGAEHVILGSFVGATSFRFLTDSLGRATSQSSLYIGLALLVVVYLMPNGLLGLVESAARRIRPAPPEQPPEVAEEPEQIPSPLGER